jgi:hypothetical protein
LPGVLLGIAGIMNLIKKNQTSVNTKYMLWIPVTIFIFWILTAMGFSSKHKANNNIPPPVPPVANIPAVINENKSAIDNKQKIIVNNFIQGFISSNRYDKPRSTNTEFVVVNVTVQNIGSSPINVSSILFELEDGAGVKRRSTMVTGLDNRFESVNLQPGGTITGNITFEAQRGSKILVLHYSGYYNSDALKIKMK